MGFFFFHASMWINQTKALDMLEQMHSYSLNADKDESKIYWNVF